MVKSSFSSVAVTKVRHTPSFWGVTCGRLVTLEVSVHGYVALLGSGEVKDHAREPVRYKAACLTVA